LVERYRARISGPLLDRIDLHVEVPAVSLAELRSRPGERSADVAARVLAARERQRSRFGERTSTPINAAMEPEELRRHCRLEQDARKLLDTAFERLHLSARAVTRILKVARTIADLAGAEKIAPGHVGEAIQYRSLDRRLGRY
jgi:magnesium chelatase family protein